MLDFQLFDFGFSIIQFWIFNYSILDFQILNFEVRRCGAKKSCSIKNGKEL